MDNPEKTALFVTVEAKFAAELHGELKRKGWLDTESKPHNSEDGRVGFPVVSGLDQGELRTHLTVPHAIIDGPFVARGPVDPHQRLKRAVQAWVSTHDINADVLECLPTKWERLGSLVLLPHETMMLPPWQALSDHAACDSLWKHMAAALKADSLGIQQPIANDTYRSSQVQMLLGTPEVRFLDHGITYIFDASKVMFSSGNVTERRRIGGMDMHDETVVDAYAGVGYYTLPMLMLAGAAHVHACEINPASVKGLRAAAKANGVEARLTVHEGDNAVSLNELNGVADRCHLGLLPSSEPVWEACLLALKPTGGMLHVHMNVEEERIEDWISTTVKRFEDLVERHGLNVDVEARHLERVKWFAPRVRHVVLDLMFLARREGEPPRPPSPFLPR